MLMFGNWLVAGHVACGTKENHGARATTHSYSPISGWVSSPLGVNECVRR